MTDRQMDILAISFFGCLVLGLLALAFFSPY